MSRLFHHRPHSLRERADSLRITELALAPMALDEKTQWAKGNTFKFGKTLTLPFFHSGIVDLPPGGEKRPKNSRKNHMIFWVFSGRVQVDVSGNVFSVGRGGMWQVPRGKRKAQAHLRLRQEHQTVSDGLMLTLTRDRELVWNLQPFRSRGPHILCTRQLHGATRR